MHLSLYTLAVFGGTETIPCGASDPGRHQDVMVGREKRAALPRAPRGGGLVAPFCQAWGRPNRKYTHGLTGTWLMQHMLTGRLVNYQMILGNRQSVPEYL